MVKQINVSFLLRTLLGFVPDIDQLFDEDVLIGSGWTARESLRPLAYSTLADLVHHVRSHLPLQHLSLAVHLFSKNVHDESLPVSIQTMSCKVSNLLLEVEPRRNRIHFLSHKCQGTPLRDICILIICEYRIIRASYPSAVICKT